MASYPDIDPLKMTSTVKSVFVYKSKYWSNNI